MVWDVLIVGGGPAGLAACDQLLETKLYTSIALVEARDRVGGKVFTEGGVDLGAQWFGKSHWRLRSLLNQYRIPYETQTTWGSGDGLVELAGVEFTPFSADDRAEIKNFLMLLERDSKAYNFDADEYNLDILSVDEYVATHVSSDVAKRECLRFVSTTLAAPCTEISALFLLFYIKSNGGVAALMDDCKWSLEVSANASSLQSNKVRHGLGSLFYQMTQMFDIHRRHGHASLFLNIPILSIDQTGDLVKLNNGMFWARRVIVCVAPTLWKSIAFTPELPPEKQKLAGALIPGRACKVVLLYEQCFWAFNESEPNLETKLFPAENFFDGYVRDRPALVCLITGENAVKYESMRGAERRKALLAQVASVFRTDAKPLEFIEMLWGLETFSGGCFAGVAKPNAGFWPLLSATHNKPFKNVWFACSEMSLESYGYVEGAIASAWNVTSSSFNKSN